MVPGNRGIGLGEFLEQFRRLPVMPMPVSATDNSIAPRRLVILRTRNPQWSEGCSLSGSHRSIV